MLYGGSKGLSPPVVLTDKHGNRMHAGRYWDTAAKKHTSGPGPGGRAYSAFPVDWDADGDFDLLVGTDKGEFHLRVNDGTAKAPAFATETRPVQAGGRQATVDSYAMPVAVDWDGDGLWDLVSGNKDGEVYWFRNTGKAGAPEFEARQCLVPPGDGPAACAQVDVADFDGDGDLDLLVGDRASNGERHGFVWLYRRIERRDG